MEKATSPSPIRRVSGSAINCIVTSPSLCERGKFSQAHFVFRSMTGQGSTANVIAAVCSFFIPGLGQLVQGRLLWALVHVIACGLLWFFFLGWIAHLWSAIDSALWKGPAR